MTQNVKVKTALLSVSDKSGLVEFARKLHNDYGIRLVSTGGTARALRDAGLDVHDVSDLTEFPEMMDGRVKTLHPRVHGGFLARRDQDDHVRSMRDHGIEAIDLVVVNLYPFEETVASDADSDDCIENIDIGGPAMVRSAAKNHDFVTIVTDVRDYDAVLDDLSANQGATTHGLRRRMAAKAYARTASYDGAISAWFAKQMDSGADYPQRYSVPATLSSTLRYGENPHQTAALYLDGRTRPGVATASQIQGKELSFNNINDTDAAFELVSEFSDQPTVAIIKHANPCGVASGATLLEAYQKALACDPVSAFGGIIACNRPIDEASAKAMIEVFTEVIIAPAIEAAALSIFAAKKNLRVLTTGGMADPAENFPVIRSVAGGLLVQDRDHGCIKPGDLKVVSDREPTDEEMKNMLFAFRVAKHVKSNAIVYVKNMATVGIGAGQMSRVDSARIAVRKSEDAAQAAGIDTALVKGSVVASDAFFPFADGLLAAAQAGATAVIQPGGSMRDDEVIEAANERSLAMVMTGMRHFRH